MRVYLHGNCQTTVLRKMLLERDSDLRINSREVHVIDLANDLDSYIDDVRNADLIISQPVRIDYRGETRLSTRWIEDNKKPSARLVTIPSVFFQGYTPAIFYLRPYDAFGMPYHDVNLVDLACSDLSVTQIVDFATGAGFMTPAFVEAEMRRSIAELRRREGSIEVPAADIIDDFYKSDVLFHTVNHPSRAFFFHFLDRLARHLGLFGSPPLAGHDYLASIVVPPNRAVIDGLGLSYRNPYESKKGQETYAGAKGFLSRPEYIAGAVDHYRREVGRDALLKAVRDHPEASAYLARYKAAHGDAAQNELARERSPG